MNQPAVPIRASNLPPSRLEPSSVFGSRLAVFAIGAILLLHLALALVYNTANPIFEAPDEIWHYLYVRHVAAGGGLPLQAVRNKNILDQQEADQPPLYYVTAAALTFWAPRGEIQEIVQPNPMGSIGDPRTDGNKNRFVHGADEHFPWTGEVWTVHLVRLVSTLYGVLTILATFMLTRELWPRRIDLATGAAAIVAFIPQFLYMDSAVSNDAAAAATSAFSLLASVYLWRRGPSWRRLLFAGCAVSLSVLAKFGDLAVLALPILALACWYYQQADRLEQAGRFVRDCLIVVGTVVVLTGWWFARNVILYHDLLPLQGFLGMSNLDPRAPTLGEFVGDLPGLWMSSWALFGWFSILVSPRLYQFFTVLGAVGLLGLGIWVVRWKIQRFAVSAALALPVVWCLVVLLALFRYRLMVAAFQGRLLFPAISGFGLLLFLGCAAYFPRRLRWAPVALVGGSLFAVAAMLPGRAIVPAYAAPPVLTAATLGKPSHLTPVEYGGDLRLLGYDISETTLQPGGSVTITLYWLARRPMMTNYYVFVHLRDRDGHILAQRDSYPGRGSFATSLWSPGNALKDPVTVEIPPDVAVPTQAFLYVGLTDPATKGRLAARSDEIPLDSFAARIGQVRLVGPPPAAVPNPRDDHFGQEVALIGYQLDRSAYAPGDTIHGTLYLRALAPMSKDYTVFVHLTREQEIDASSILAQQDGQPANGNF
ncbi:MAG TPA: hypothetical protein VFZ25_00945, partial [Chloroflexota bacterium]|nr:hypothetical protein [Chloroflexota bacterium]